MVFFADRFVVLSGTTGPCGRSQEGRRGDGEEDGVGAWDTDEDEAAEDEVDESTEAASCSYVRRWCTCRYSGKCATFPLAFQLQ